jgi:hypothetical protein
MITFRRAFESDYPRINDFHNKLYQTSRTIEEFYWEFHNAPAGNSIYIIAEDDGKVVGTQCIIPIFLITDKGERILSGKSEDTLVDPTYRGKDIFNGMYHLLFEECTNNKIMVIWGFTSAKKPFQKLGFDIPYDHSQVIMVNNLTPSYSYLSALNKNNKYNDRIKIAGLCLLSKLKKETTFSRSFSKEYQFKQEPVVNITSLLTINLQYYRPCFSIDQTDDYQRWRIYGNPNYKKVYSFSLRDNEGNLSGVFTANLNPSGIAYIIQCLFDPRVNPNIRKSFLLGCSKIMFNDGIHAIRNWTFSYNIFSNSEIELFSNSGYYFIDRGVGFVWKQCDCLPVMPQNFLLSRIATQGTI